MLELLSSEADQTERQRRYKARYRERVKADPEKLAAYRESVRKMNRIQYLKNPEKRKEKQRAWHAANKPRTAAQNKKWRTENKDYFRRYMQAYYKANYIRIFWRSVASTAKIKGVEFDLDEGWFRERLVAGVCEISGFPFERGTQKRGLCSPSVDRIIAGGPYTKANCRMIVWGLNMAFSNFGQAKVIDLFRHVIRRLDDTVAT